MDGLLTMVVETPRGSLAKRGEGGRLDFLSPVPAPFNYGRIEGVSGADGEGQDALLLGPRLSAGARFQGRSIGAVRFLDAGLADDKWILSPAGRVSPAEFHRIHRFFSMYTVIKNIGGLLRSGSCNTSFQGIDLWKPNHME